MSVGNLVPLILRSKGLGKTKPKLLVHLNITDRELSDCESLNEVTSLKRCVTCLTNREVTMYRGAVLY
jgi:hypothetical protein